MSNSWNPRRLLSLMLSAAAAATLLTVVAAPAHAAERNIRFTVDGLKLDTNPADVWKGYGAVTANNTSRALLDYKEEHPDQYWRIMNDTFNPLTGLGLTHVKIEMGNDANTSSGTEPATKRTATEAANVLRGAGFHFAADAKSINPKIEVSLLRWADPAWVRTSEDRYQWYKQTIDAAYDSYRLPIDWISPNQNETLADVPFITYFGRRLRQDAAGGTTRYDYSKIKIVSSDELDTSKMADEMITLVNPASLSQSQKDSARTPDGDRARALAEAVDPANANQLWKVSYPQYDEGVAAYYYRVRNQEYMSLIQALAHHYTTVSTPQMAILNRTYGRQIWFSEAVAGVGHGVALQNNGMQDRGETALGVADLFINSFRNAGSAANSGGYPTAVKDAHHSLYLFQPSIAAFPQATTFSTKANIHAHDAWSGWYERDLGYFVTKQFTNFARPGSWQYVEGGATQGGGRQSGHSIEGAGDSRLALAAPDRSDFSLVLNNHSNDTMNYTIDVTNMSVAQRARLAVYRTQMQDGASFDSNWFQRLDNIDIRNKNADGSFAVTVTVAPHSVYTLTTLGERELPAPHRAGDRTFNDSRPVLDGSSWLNPQIYSDDFEYANPFRYPKRQVAWDYRTFNPGNTDPTRNATRPTGPKLSYLDRRGNTPRYTHDMSGAFEVNDDGTGNNSLVQQLDYNHIPGPWVYGGRGKPETLIGDDRWANYTVTADIRFDTTTPVSNSYANYVGLGGRSNREGNGYLFLLRPDGTWGVVQDAGDASSIAPAMTAANTLAHGKLPNFVTHGSHKVAVTMRHQSVAVTVDGRAVTTWSDPDGFNTRLSGRVHIVSGWYRNSFDNLTVTRVPGYAATLTEYVDDGADRMRYTGSVTHHMVGFSALYRSATTLNAGGGFQLAFHGTGFLLEAETGQSGLIDVAVDGKVVATGVPVSASRTRNVGYALTDLPHGPHTIQVTSTTGGLKLDGVGVYGAIAPWGGAAQLWLKVAQYWFEHLRASD
ncbi:MAG TPA: hypothetical protein VF755_24450, partial [Catenuloplanes sp.]